MLSKDSSYTCAYCKAYGTLENDVSNKKTYSRCFTQYNVLETGYNHRINHAGKFDCNRIQHFRNFQGKQKCTIPQNDFDDIEANIRSYNLLDTRYDDRKLRYAKVTKRHLTIFIKELHYTKYSDNISLIFSKITGSILPDISHIEEDNNRFLKTNRSVRFYVQHKCYK